MNMLAAIFIGGGAGALMRHFSLIAAARFLGEGVPYGTVIVNVTGSLMAGFLMEMLALKWNMPVEMRAMIFTGFLGGFTTFSAFSLDVLKLANAGAYVSAAFYVAASVALSIIAVFGGMFLARGIAG